MASASIPTAWTLAYHACTYRRKSPRAVLRGFLGLASLLTRSHYGTYNAPVLLHDLNDFSRTMLLSFGRPLRVAPVLMQAGNVWHKTEDPCSDKRLFTWSLPYHENSRMSCLCAFWRRNMLRGRSVTGTSMLASTPLPRVTVKAVCGLQVAHLL